MKLRHIILGALLCAFLVSPMACTDELVERIENIEDRLDRLEIDLNAQLDAFDAFVNGGGITVSQCTKNEDGSYKITLSDGTSFTALPSKASFSALICVTKVDGKDCWATYNSNGKLIPLTDADGKRIPVDLVPEVVERDGIFYLKVAGQEFETGFDVDDLVQVFSSYEVHEDESGQVHSVTFNFGEGYSFTATVDGFQGFAFVTSGLYSEMMTELFVASGSSLVIKAEVTAVENYLMQIPDGWRVKEENTSVPGEMYFKVSAPSQEAVAAGYAESEGDLKVVAVLQGGKSVVSKLYLTTEAFNEITVTATDVVIDVNYGVQKYFYGLSLSSEYDADAALAKAGEMLESGEEEVSDLRLSMPEAYGRELTPGESYVLWTIPALCDDSDNFYLRKELLESVEFTHFEVVFGETVTSFNDAFVSVDIRGADMYYGGTFAVSEMTLEDVLMSVNDGGYEAFASPMAFDGSAFAFPSPEQNEGMTAVPGQSYVTWVVPVREGKETYTSEDVFFTEYDVRIITGGGSLEVTAGEAVKTCVSVEVPLSCPGAYSVYYKFMDKTENYNNDTEELRAELLLNEGLPLRGGEGVVMVEHLQPKTDTWLVAVAVDDEGRYGPVFYQSYKTEELKYNSLKVSLSNVECGADVLKFKVDVQGEEPAGYVYWVGKATDSFFMGKDHLGLGQTKTNAKKFMALYPEHDEFKKVMMQYPMQDGGMLCFDELNSGTKYYVAVSARSEDGLYSSEIGWTFAETVPFDVGNVAKSDDQRWIDASADVKLEFIPESFGPANPNLSFTSYSFDFSCPKDMTAYVMCASRDYFSAQPELNTVESRIIHLVEAVDEAETTSYNPLDADGNMLEWKENYYYNNLFKYYIHGDPRAGNVVYFAEGTYDPASDKRYADALKSIEDWRNPQHPSWLSKEEYDAHLPHYAEGGDCSLPVAYVNDGSKLRMGNPYAFGVREGLSFDTVYVVLKDSNDDYYETMSFEVPNLFK